MLNLKLYSLIINDLWELINTIHPVLPNIPVFIIVRMLEKSKFYNPSVISKSLLPIGLILHCSLSTFLPASSFPLTRSVSDSIQLSTNY